MYCPHCQSPLSAVSAKRIPIKEKGKTIAHGIAYFCLGCSKVLNIERLPPQSRRKSQAEESPDN
jgi:RNase P subunit RPR2